MNLPVSNKIVTLFPHVFGQDGPADTAILNQNLQALENLASQVAAIKPGGGVPLSYALGAETGSVSAGSGVSFTYPAGFISSPDIVFNTGSGAIDITPVSPGIPLIGSLYIMSIKVSFTPGGVSFVGNESVLIGTGAGSDIDGSWGPPPAGSSGPSNQTVTGLFAVPTGLAVQANLFNQGPTTVGYDVRVYLVRVA